MRSRPYLPMTTPGRPAMEHADQGAPVAVLTNGTRATTQQLRERNGLADLVSDIVTVHDAHRWKPAPEPYHFVSARADLEPHEAALVTVHGWDICGARHAGVAHRMVLPARTPSLPTSRARRRRR